MYTAKPALPRRSWNPRSHPQAASKNAAPEMGGNSHGAGTASIRPRTSGKRASCWSSTVCSPASSRRSQPRSVERPPR